MNRRSSRMAKLSFMIMLTFLFFITELIYGHLTGSLALIGDSYHMISDVIALVIGLASVSVSSRSSTQNTFGWARAEILGALVNSVFLAALCFTIFVEAIERIVKPSFVEDPQTLLIVGCLGLVINLIGLFIFCNEAHVHSHGHSHGHGHGHSHGRPKKVQPPVEILPRKAFSATIKSKVFRTLPFVKRGLASPSTMEAPDLSIHDHTSVDSTSSEEAITSTRLNTNNIMAIGWPRVMKNIRILESSRTFERITISNDKGDHGKGSASQILSNDLKKKYPGYLKRPHDPYTLEEGGNMNFNHGGGEMNIRGVLLHMMGDALGSVVVIVTAIMSIKGGDAEWVQYMDPSLSMVMVLIIMSTTFPLFRQSSLILLQHVPGHIQIESLQERLSEIEGVMGIHSLHIWQLVGSKLIGSVHVQCKGPEEYAQIAKVIRDIFSDEGICSITIQPEFVDRDEDLGKCSMMGTCDEDKICPSTFTLGKPKVSAHSSHSFPETMVTAKSVESVDAKNKK